MFQTRLVPHLVQATRARGVEAATGGSRSALASASSVLRCLSDLDTSNTRFLARTSRAAHVRAYSTQKGASHEVRHDTKVHDQHKNRHVMECTKISSLGARCITIKQPLKLEMGGELESVSILWEEWGDEKNPVVMVFPALSASSHVASSLADPTAGWWNEVVGPGKGIDTTKFRVICASILGSPFGSSSPLSKNPQTGLPYGPDFPAVTPGDLATVHKLLLDFLGIERAHAVIGSSLGGMQVFKFAAQFPEAVDRAISIAATGKTTPGTVAFRRVQRLAIMSDPDFKNGKYAPAPGPMAGLRVARELGTITYRSRDEFNERFEWKPQPPYEWKNMCFEVESYLNAQAQKFTHVYDANCYLTLSRCMDLMDLGYGFPNYAEGVARITAKTYIIGINSDMLIPVEEPEHLSKLMKALGKPVKFEIMSSLFGHDAFLKEPEWLNVRIRKWLESADPLEETQLPTKKRGIHDTHTNIHRLNDS